MQDFRAGTYERHFWKKEYEYESFAPSRINRELPLSDTRIPVMLEEATAVLGELNERTRAVPNVQAFIRMSVRGEAVSSSAIEGTGTGMDEVVLPEDAIAPERRDDWREVQNYVAALLWGAAALKKLPVSQRLLCGLHKRLLSGTRGAEKRPGEVRTSQNWIGGASIRTAHFIPPYHERVPALLSDWESYWHNRTISVPNLIRIAIGHYQFETIHPFPDGNGRVGRLLIVLQLMERGMLDAPVLYLSGYFERHRRAYDDALDRVRERDDIESWIKFFLEGVREAATSGKDTAARVETLVASHRNRIDKLGRRRELAVRLLEALYTDPATTVVQAAVLLDVHYDTANELIAELERLGILAEITGQARHRRYEMKEYVELFRRA